jgi:hypothetical protein
MDMSNMNSMNEIVEIRFQMSIALLNWLSNDGLNRKRSRIQAVDREAAVDAIAGALARKWGGRRRRFSMAVPCKLGGAEDVEVRINSSEPCPDSLHQVVRQALEEAIAEAGVRIDGQLASRRSS